MLPGALGQPVVSRQRSYIQAEVGSALHVAVPDTDIAQRELKDAQRPHIGGADRVLGDAHAPDQRRGPVLRHDLRHLADLVARHAGHPLDLLRGPFLDLGADLVHAVDALLDIGLVFPAVLEDVPEHPPDQRNVRARPKPDILGRVSRRAGEAGIDDDQVRLVDFLAAQHVLQRNRMGLGGIAADDQDRLGVMDVVVAVGHGAVAPCVRNARDRRGVADARLMVHRVGAPERRHLAEQVRALVRELGRAQPEHRFRRRLLADLQQLRPDLVDRLFPAQPRPLAVHQLHRIFQPAVAMDQFAHRSALGAMRAVVDRAVPARLLADPDAVLNFRRDRAADRAVGADALLAGDLDPRNR